VQGFTVCPNRVATEKGVAGLTAAETTTLLAGSGLAGDD
jgi:hypothetical protein